MLHEVKIKPVVRTIEVSYIRSLQARVSTAKKHDVTAADAFFFFFLMVKIRRIGENIPLYLGKRIRKCMQYSVV